MRPLEGEFVATVEVDEVRWIAFASAEREICHEGERQVTQRAHDLLTRRL